MVMFALGGYPGKEKTFSLCYHRWPLCWLTDNRGMSETAWLCTMQFLAKDSPGHQSLHPTPHSAVSEVLPEQMVVGIPFTVSSTLFHRVRYDDDPLHIIPLPSYSIFGQVHTKDSFLMFECFDNCFEGLLSSECLWKDTLQFQVELAFACNLCWVGDRNTGTVLTLCDCSTVRGVLAFPRKGHYM